MNRIIWRRWQDPMAPMVRGRPAAAFEPREDEDDPDYHGAVSTFGGGGDENPYDDGQPRGPLGPCVLGPMGVVPLHESNLPSKLFNFWMGDANFHLTPRVVDAVAAVPGVESLDVFTPYRFRMAVGRAFDEREVKAAVEAAAAPPAPAPRPAPPPADPLGRLKETLARAFPHWAVATVGGDPRGVGGATAEEVRAKLEKLGAAAVVAASWEVR